MPLVLPVTVVDVPECRLYSREWTLRRAPQGQQVPFGPQCKAAARSSKQRRLSPTALRRQAARGLWRVWRSSALNSYHLAKAKPAIWNGTVLESASSVMRQPDFETNWVSPSNPATVTVPAWFTLGAARKVAVAKGVLEVAFYDQRGCRTTLALAGLMGVPASRLLANCHSAQDLQTRQAA